jgi:hypothetical protein
LRLALGQAYARKRGLLPFFLDILAFFLPTLVRVFDGRSKAEKVRMVGTDTVAEGTPKVAKCVGKKSDCTHKLHHSEHRLYVGTMISSYGKNLHIFSHGTITWSDT